MPRDYASLKLLTTQPPIEIFYDEFLSEGFCKLFEGMQLISEEVDVISIENGSAVIPVNKEKVFKALLKTDNELAQGLTVLYSQKPNFTEFHFLPTAVKILKD